MTFRNKQTIHIDSTNFHVFQQETILDIFICWHVYIMLYYWWVSSFSGFLQLTRVNHNQGKVSTHITQWQIKLIVLSGYRETLRIEVKIGQVVADLCSELNYLKYSSIETPNITLFANNKCPHCHENWNNSKLTRTK